MLDTCVLVDFFLIYAKEDKKQKIPKSLKKQKELLSKYESTKFHNVMSFWTRWELRQTIMRFVLYQKFIESGYYMGELGNAKREIKLTNEEKTLVNQSVRDIWKYSFRRTETLETKDLLEIERITEDGFTFMDVVHIIQAKKTGCDFFVTRDRDLHNIKLISKKIGIKIMGLKEFLNKLK